MTEGTRMNQMGDNIVAMKKPMEKYDKEFERMDNQARQKNLDVDRRFDEVLTKLNFLIEMMTARKLDSPQPAVEAMGWDAEEETRKQQFVLPNPSGKNKEVMRDEGVWTSGSSFPMQWQKRSPVQQFSNDFHHHGNREGRTTWQ
jgi:hypothetical protein